MQAPCMNFPGQFRGLGNESVTGPELEKQGAWSDGAGAGAQEQNGPDPDPLCSS